MVCAFFWVECSRIAGRIIRRLRRGVGKWRMRFYSVVTTTTRVDHHHDGSRLQHFRNGPVWNANLHNNLLTLLSQYRKASDFPTSLKLGLASEHIRNSGVAGVAGVLECWSAGVLECWSAGVLECWSAGVLEYWSTGVLECWSAGVLECWSAGVLECWSAGVLECWSTGVLECWSAGVLECWSAGVLEYWSARVLECWSS